MRYWNSSVLLVLIAARIVSRMPVGTMVAGASSSRGRAMVTTVTTTTFLALRGRDAAARRGVATSTLLSSSRGAFLGRAQQQRQQQQQLPQTRRRTSTTSFLVRGGAGDGEQPSSSCLSGALGAAATTAAVAAASLQHRNHSSMAAECVSADENDGLDEDAKDQTITTTLFPEESLEYDHYNGVTVHVDERLLLSMEDNFAANLGRQLQVWRAEGKRGVWLHVPKPCAAVIPVATELGFEFHLVAASATSAESSSPNSNVLVLSKWLPTDTPNRLPVGPTHQVGVGCVVWHPLDGPGANRRMLVVQEQTGPARAYNLWKMPTGLADPSEDIHEAAVRELQEETGLQASFGGLLAFRQAHSTPPAPNGDSSKKTTTSVRRKNSDLFFVCQMQLPARNTTTAAATSSSTIDDDETYWEQQWTACPTEIAAIRWMKVSDYCNQERWQGSPVYMELNRAILDAAASDGDSSTSSPSSSLWENYTLPLLAARPDDDSVETTTVHTNALYKSSSKQ